MSVDKNLINEVEKLKTSLEEISVYDLGVYSALELYYDLAKKLNEIIRELSRFEGVVSDEVIKQNDKLLYLLNEGLKLEVALKLSEFLENGTLDDIINHSVFEGLSNKIDYIVPSSLDNLNESLSNLKNNTTLILNGEYIGEGFTLENKENITIIGSATLKQQIDVILKPTYEKPTSDKPLFKIKDCKNIKVIGLNFLPDHEGIDIENCEGVVIDSCKVNGNYNTSRFNGLVSRGGKNITFNNCEVINCGELPQYDNASKRNLYSQGHGIGCYIVEGVNIVGCTVKGCAQNGVYTFACNNVKVNNNLIECNGMSGVQFAFGLGSEKGYVVDSNIIKYNFSDGVDILNTMEQMLEIDCIISNNLYEDNGWFNKDKNKITQDGSGVATLINVSNVTGSNNIVSDSARSTLHISNCENINIKCKAKMGTFSEGTMIYIGGSKNIEVEINGEHYCNGDNAIAFDSTFKANENIKIKNSNVYSDTMMCFYMKGSNPQENIFIEDSIMKTRTSSNGVDSRLIINNVTFISVENIGVTLTEEARLRNCKIFSYAREGVFMTNKSSLINCEVHGTIGCNISNVHNVYLINSMFRGSNNGVRLDNTTNTTISNCDIMGFSHGLHSNGSSSFKIVDSMLSSVGGGNSIRCENGTTVFTDNNIYNGVQEFTSSTHKQLQWN